MEPIDERTLLFWIGIISMVFIVSLAGMLINRYFIYRAHRKAIEELHPQRVSASNK